MAKQRSQTKNSGRRRRSKRISNIQTLNNKCAVIYNRNVEKAQAHDVSLRDDPLLKINNSVNCYSFDVEDEKCKLKLDLSNMEWDGSNTVCNKRRSRRRKTPVDKHALKKKTPSHIPTLKRKLPTDKHVQKADRSLMSKKIKLGTMPMVDSKSKKTIPQMQRKVVSKRWKKNNVSSQNISVKTVISTPSSSTRSQLDPACMVNGNSKNTTSQHKKRKVTPKTTNRQGVASQNPSDNAMTSTPSLSTAHMNKNVEPELSPVIYLEEAQPQHRSPFKTVRTLIAASIERKTPEPLADKSLVSPIQRMDNSDSGHLFGFVNSVSECVDSKEDGSFQATEENIDPFRPLDISKTYHNHSIGFFARSFEKKKRKKHIAKSKRCSSSHYDALASKMNEEFEELAAFELSIV